LINYHSQKINIFDPINQRLIYNPWLAHSLSIAPKNIHRTNWFGSSVEKMPGFSRRNGKSSDAADLFCW